MNRRSFLSACGALAASFALPFRCFGIRASARPHLSDDSYIALSWFRIDRDENGKYEGEVRWRMADENEFRTETLPVRQDGESIGMDVCDNVFIGLPFITVDRDVLLSVDPIQYHHELPSPLSHDLSTPVA